MASKVDGFSGLVQIRLGAEYDVHVGSKPALLRASACRS
jgi:hypothetical protein